MQRAFNPKKKESYLRGPPNKNLDNSESKDYNKPMTDDPRFQPAFDKFLAEAQAICDEYRAKNFPLSCMETLTADPGRRYIRVWKVRKDHKAPENETNRYAYCFVDRTNGDILKAATWKAPAKHARGNIYAEKTSEAVDWHGAKYLR